MHKILQHLGLSAALLLSSAALVNAAEITVKMLNKGADGQAMVFEPAAVKAEVGDVIRFVPADKGHDAVSIKGLIPEGVSDFKGKINQELVITLEKEGAYVVKCTPHFAMGMVGLIVAGNASADEATKLREAKMPKKAKERVEAQLTSLGL